jgi:hypothetical protein
VKRDAFSPMSNMSRESSWLKPRVDEGSGAGFHGGL